MKAIKILTSAMLIAFAMTAKGQSEMRKVYNEEIDPMEQIDAAVAKARQEDKFVICQVGGNWCPWCLRFADFITKDTTISTLIEENFEYIHVNYNPRNKEAEAKAKPMLRRLNNPGRFGFPVFVVLDTEGKVLHIQDSSFLEEEQGYDKEKVLRFFRNWAPLKVKSEE